jgi:hypothetical protein
MAASAYYDALLSKHVYEGEKLKPGLKVDSSGWMVYRVFSGSFGYFSTLFINQRARKLILAHRGTNSLGALLTDLKGIVNHRYTKQQSSCIAATEKSVQIAKQIKYSLSFTGHSLGAWHAEQSLLYAKVILQYPCCHTISFESPGSLEMLAKQFRSNISFHDDTLAHPDIIEYLSYPNAINTFNHHAGTVIHIKPYVPPNLKKRKLWHSLESHSIENIVEALSEDNVASYYMLDWPLGLQYLSSDKDRKKEPVSDFFKSHFRINHDFNPDYDLPLQHFDLWQEEMLLKLEHTFKLSNTNSEAKDKLRKKWYEEGIDPRLISTLLSYHLIRKQDQLWVCANSHESSINRFTEHLNNKRAALQDFEERYLSLNRHLDTSSPRSSVIN